MKALALPRSQKGILEHTLADHSIEAAPKQFPNILRVWPFTWISLSKDSIDVCLHALLPYWIHSQTNQGEEDCRPRCFVASYQWSELAESEWWLRKRYQCDITQFPMISSIVRAFSTFSELALRKVFAMREPVKSKSVAREDPFHFIWGHTSNISIIGFIYWFLLIPLIWYVFYQIAFYFLVAK